MNKLIIYILILFSCISCKKRHTSIDSKNSILSDTLYYNSNNIKVNKDLKVNTAFDSLKVKKLEEDEASRPFMQFSNNLTSDINTFFNKMLLIDNSLNSIKHYEDNVELYFTQGDSVNFYKNIYGDSSYWVFNHYMYHDIYNSLFSFSNVNSIKVYVENTITDKSNLAYNPKFSIRNITLLPLSGDYEILLPNGTMKKKWYIKNSNYWDIISDEIFSSPKLFSDKNLEEIKEESLDSIIKNYSLKQ